MWWERRVSSNWRTMETTKAAVDTVRCADHHWVHRAEHEETSEDRFAVSRLRHPSGIPWHRKRASRSAGGREECRADPRYAPGAIPNHPSEDRAGRTDTDRKASSAVMTENISFPRAPGAPARTRKCPLRFRWELNDSRGQALLRVLVTVIAPTALCYVTMRSFGSQS